MFTTVADLRLDSDRRRPSLPGWLAALPRGAAGPFASLTAAALAALPKPAAATEPRTKTAFPGEYCHLVKKACPRLTGVGARSKRIIKNIDVYALGVYVDGPGLAARAAAAATPDAAVAALADDASLPKTVRVVVTTGLMTAPRFLKSVKESLLPALTARGAARSFDAFADLFAEAPLAKGTEIVFSNAPDGSLAVRIAGRDVGSVKDTRFGPALFGLWLGPAPVSPDAKASVTAGVAAAGAAAKSA